MVHRKPLRKSPRKPLLIAIASGLILGVTVLSWQIASRIMSRLPEVCDKAAFVYCGSPQEQNLSYKNFTILEQDRSTLSGWFIPSTRNSKMIIFSHGHGGNRREGMRFAQALHDAGYGILSFDYRYVLQNQGATNTMGWNERRELSRVVSYAKTLGAEHIGVYGFSQGAAATILAMADDPRIEAAALEAPYANLKDSIADIFMNTAGIPAFPIINITMKFFELRSASDLEKLNPELFIANLLPRPLYLIHDRKDPTIDISHTERLVLRAPTAQTWFYDYGKHAQSWQFDPKTAESRLVKFYDAAFSGPLARAEK